MPRPARARRARCATASSGGRPAPGSPAGHGGHRPPDYRAGRRPARARATARRPGLRAPEPRLAAARRWSTRAPPARWPRRSGPRIATGLPRIADGDGDGVPERDLGAFELAPPRVPLPAGNLLRDPGAEAGGAWALSGGFTRERYGAFPFPSAAAGAALGGGRRVLRRRRRRASATATQRVDVGAARRRSTSATATVTLSGAARRLPRRRGRGRARATFLDPAGAPIGAVALAAPTAAQRANATTLLPRTRTDAVPRLTRAIDGHAARHARGRRQLRRRVLRQRRAHRRRPGRAAAAAAGPGAGAQAVRRRPRAHGPRRRRPPGPGLGAAACLDATVGRCRGVLTLTARLAGRRARPPAPPRRRAAGREPPRADRAQRRRAAPSAAARRSMMLSTPPPATGRGSRARRDPAARPWQPPKRPLSGLAEPLGGSVPAGTCPRVAGEPAPGEREPPAGPRTRAQVARP